MKYLFRTKKIVCAVLFCTYLPFFGQSEDQPKISKLFQNQKDSTISSILSQNTFLFSNQNKRFAGEGWERIMDGIKNSRHVLIGEDHFFSEIPLFVERITDEVKFDNFICEIDPFSAKIIEEKMQSSSAGQLHMFESNFGNTLSFFALLPEYELLKKLVGQNINIIGTDQVIMTADRLLVSDLKKTSTNIAAKKIYSEIEEKSKKDLPGFVSGKGIPYFFSQSFGQQLETLHEMDLSQKETEVIEALELSKKIYSTQSHSLRIQLMKNNFFDALPQIKGHKNLYKFGAIHMGKGESILGGFDLGNVVYNVADSEFGSSVHIMVIGKNGIQGSPMKGKSNRTLDISKGPLQSLLPFFDLVKGQRDWYVFDIGKIKKDLNKITIKIEDRVLRNLLNGYDFLVVIPEVTPATFIY